MLLIHNTTRKKDRRLEKVKMNKGRTGRVKKRKKKRGQSERKKAARCKERKTEVLFRFTTV